MNQHKNQYFILHSVLVGWFPPPPWNFEKFWFPPPPPFGSPPLEVLKNFWLPPFWFPPPPGNSKKCFPPLFKIFQNMVPPPLKRGGGHYVLCSRFSPITMLSDSFWHQTGVETMLISKSPYLIDDWNVCMHLV